MITGMPFTTEMMNQKLPISHIPVLTISESIGSDVSWTYDCSNVRSGGIVDSQTRTITRLMNTRAAAHVK